MLVLSRRNQESVMVGGGGSFPGLLKVTVLEVTSGKVKLGFEVAPDVPVHRLELWERMRARGEFECLTTDGPPAQVELS
jgi:carbon storage regulator CsrA